jgi:hypothetical protein
VYLEPNATDGGNYSQPMYMPTYCVGGSANNPDWGQTNYDNYGSALLVAFALITTEGWSSTVRRITLVASQS